MNPPNDIDLPRFIEEFKSNMQLLFHNKFTGKEGILLLDITPMYYRYFNIHVTPSKIVTPEKQKDLKDPYDWVPALSGSSSLTSFFKINRERTHLLLKNKACRPESEMKSIANVANYNVLNAKGFQQLINLVVVKYTQLPVEEKLAFKSEIMQHINAIPEEAPNSQVMPGEGPFSVSLPQFPIPFPLPASINGGPFDGISSPGDINHATLLEDLIGNGNCNGNGDIGLLVPHSSQMSEHSRKRRISSSSSNDNPDKRLKSSVSEPSALIQSPEPAPLITSADLVQDATPVVDENVDIIATNINSIATINSNGLFSPTETGTPLKDDDIAVDTDEIWEDTNAGGMVNGQSSPRSSNHVENFHMRHSTCDVEKKICDDMAVLKEFSADVDEKLDSNEWVIFFVSQDEQGHYKGREKLNLQAKLFCLESKTWKHPSNQNRKLRLPNKMIAFGEFLIENGETFFEVIDCWKCNEDSNLLNIPFIKRYEKAQEMISQSTSGAVEGIPVRMKPYFTMDNLPRLSGQAMSENATGTLLFITRDIPCFKNPRTFKFDNPVSLINLLQQKVFFSLRNYLADGDDNTLANIVPINVPEEIEESVAENDEVNPPAVNHTDTDDIHESPVNGSAENEINIEVIQDLPKTTENDPITIQAMAEHFALALHRDKVSIPIPIRSPNINKASPNHTCTVKCANAETWTRPVTLSNPFLFCEAYGWERNKSGQKVTYLAPCKKTFETYKQVMDFLLRTDFAVKTHPCITIDFFSFEHEIRERVEFPVWNVPVINSDISQNMEEVPITCVNEMDDTILPPFSYIVKSSTGNNVNLPIFDIGNECICTDECQNNCCSCVTDTTKRHTKGFISSSCVAKYKGYDFRRLFRCVPRGIYECNFKCKCSVNEGVYCGNRVVQNRMKWKLQVFRKADGWGVRTLHDIPIGHFVCQFIGKIVLEEEAANGENRYQVKLGPTYDCPYKNCKHQLGDETSNKNSRTPLRKTRGRHICLNTLEDQNLYIDATNEGNIGRFINHAPKSNVFMQTVFIEENLKSRPHIAFFAKENILAGKELTSNFSTVRKGINESVNEKESESFTQRPGPKKATGKRDQEIRKTDLPQYSQSQVPDNKENGTNDNDQLHSTNLCSVDNDDVLSQGSSRSSTRSYRSANQLPVVRLEKIKIDQTLIQHKLSRSQSNTSTEATTEMEKQSIPTVTQIKTEPVDTSNIKQEIVTIEIGNFKIEKTEDGDPFPHLNSPREILGNLDADGNDAEMMVDNPEMTINNSEMIVDNPEMTINNSEMIVDTQEMSINNSETTVNTSNPVVTEIVNNPETVNNAALVIDLTEDSSDNLDFQHVVDVIKVKVEKAIIANLDLSANRQESNDDGAAPRAPECEQRSSILPSVLPHTELDKSATGSVNQNLSKSPESPKRSNFKDSPSKSKRTKKMISQSQSQPGTSKAASASTSFLSLAATEHSVEDCMKICCIHNESGFPENVARNKLFCCRVFGFERKFENEAIFYETPCGKRFMDEQSIFEFLLEAKHPVLAIDNFDFNPQVECSPTVWMNEQCFDLNPNTYTVTEDITVGEEMIPIRCKTSEIGVEQPNFRYISKCEYSGQYRQETLFLPENCICDCEDGCVDAKKCICLRRTTFRNEISSSESASDKLKNSHGYRYRKLLKPEFKGIFECGSMCLCPSNCSNRVVQNDMAWSLEVFNTPNTGWGVRTLQDIPQGAFVCNFVGLVKSATEADTGNRQYQVKVTLPKSGAHLPNVALAGPIHRDNKYIIDATREGNLARFINHSCSPNLFPQTVFVAHPFMKVVPYVSFFANQNIVATTELTFNYKGVIEDETNSMVACFCGSSNCKESFL